MSLKNDDLDNLLKHDPLPRRPDGYWDAFPGRVATRLQSSFRSSTPAEKTAEYRFAALFAIGFGLGLACLILVIKYGTFFHPEALQSSNEAKLEKAKAYARIITEVWALFPNRVRSVELEDDDIEMNLADHADVATSPPIWVQICLGGRCKKFITFSGQQVGVDGHLYDVLVDSRGNIMLTGEKSVWSSGDRVAAALPGARISAHVL